MINGKESKDYEKECILQKHDNVHKTYIGIYISLLVGLTEVFFQIPFKEETSRSLVWIIARDNHLSGAFIVGLFMLLMASIITYLINKTAEYEIFLKKRERIPEEQKI